MIWHGHDPSQHYQLKKMLCKIRKLRKSIIYILPQYILPCIERIYLSYGWNIQFQKRHNNTQQYFNYLIRGSLRKLYKYPVKPRKYWETLLYKDLLNNLSCYLSCLCASVSSNISAFGRKYFCLPGRKYFCLSGSKFCFCRKANVFRCERHEHFRYSVCYV